VQATAPSNVFTTGDDHHVQVAASETVARIVTLPPDAGTVCFPATTITFRGTTAPAVAGRTATLSPTSTIVIDRHTTLVTA
jgi:hypothetical protein